MENKLKNLTFEEFSQLVEFLKNIYRTQKSGAIEGKQEEKEFVAEHISGFFPSLTALQEVRMMGVLNDLTENAFLLFQDEFPEIEIDSTGKGIKRQKRYWEVTLESLEQLYNNSKENPENPASKQAIDGKELNCLKRKRYTSYIALKPLFLKKFNEIVPEYKLKQMEQFLSEYFGKERASIILSQFIGYCWEHRKQPRNFSLFASHFLNRVECAAHDYNTNGDKSIDLKANRDFLENIENVIKQYFIKK